MKAAYTILKHADGFEVSYRDATGTYEADTGERYQTRKEAQARLLDLRTQQLHYETGDRAYAAGYAYACGYSD